MQQEMLEHIATLNPQQQAEFIQKFQNGEMDELMETAQAEDGEQKSMILEEVVDPNYEPT